MAARNVELVRRLYSASAELFATGDLDRLDRSLYDPAVEWFDAAEQPDAQSYRGFEGVQRAMARFLEAWAQYSCEVERIFDRGDRVVHSPTSTVSAAGAGCGSISTERTCGGSAVKG
jgi:ketosteroid isomerase-like protein